MSHAPDPEESGSLPRPVGGPNATRGEVSLVPVMADGAEDLLHRIGRETRESLGYLGGLSRLSASFFRVFGRKPLGMRAIVDQCEAIGLKSLPIALLIMFFVGLVFALQFGVE